MPVMVTKQVCYCMNQTDITLEQVHLVQTYNASRIIMYMTIKFSLVNMIYKNRQDGVEGVSLTHTHTLDL